MPIQDFYVRPNCCQDVQSPDHVAVYLCEVTGHSADGSEDPDPPEFRWVIMGKERNARCEDGWFSRTALAKHCPFCGQKLPELRIVDAPGPVCTVTDGGYYCDTCGDRLDSCQCYPPEACFVAWGDEAPLPRMQFLEIETKAIAFRVCFKEREAFVPEKMLEHADKMAAESGRKIVSWSSDKVRTRFGVDKPFTETEVEELSHYWWGWEGTL